MLATLSVCIALAVFYGYHRADEELRRYLEQAIAQKCPDHSIKIGSARWIHGEGIRLREVSVMRSGARPDTSHAELAYCDEVSLYCNLNMQDLCQGNVKIQRALLRGLLIQPTRDRNGTWNLASLFSDHATDLEIPMIEIEGAQVEIRDFASPQPTQLTLRDVHASVAPLPEHPGKLQVDASLGSQHFQSARLLATIDPAQPGAWQASGQIENLNCNQAMRHILAMQRVNVPPLLDGLHAVAQVRFSAAQAVTEPTPRFDIEARVDNGKFEAPNFLAHTISDISIPRIKIVDDGQRQQWSLQDVRANYGASRIHMKTASGPSLHLDSDIDVDVFVDDLNMTRELVEILPAKQQALWQKYQPLGRVDVHARSLRRAGRWFTNANATCTDITLECEKFRYPLTRCHGKLSFQQGKELKVDLWAAPDRTWRTNPIHIVADVRNPGKKFTGEVHVGMQPNTWLPIDMRVHNATPPGVRKVLDDMAAHGEMNFKTILRRNSPNQIGLQKETLIQVRRGGIKYLRFPYPLQDVSGKIYLTDDIYEFSDFQGFNDSCTVTCMGTWRKYGANGNSQLDLQFAARDIPCDTELRDALPAGPQQIWSDLRPAGTIDHATINLRHQAGWAKSEIGVEVTQLSRSDNPDGRSLEMKPTWFPLSMDRVTGEFRLAPSGEFSLQNIQAEHGSLQRTVKLRTDGGGIFRHDGSWEILLDRVIADRVQTTPEFIAALPKKLSDAMKTLKFQGTLFVNAQDVHFTASPDPRTPIRASWSSTINVDNGAFTLAGQPVKNLYGAVSVSGQRQAEWVNYGNATFDTLNCKDIHISNLETPWYLDSQRLVFGNAVRVNGRKTRAATAEVFGGTAEATGQIGFSDDIGFGLSLSVSDFDVGHTDLKIPSRISGRGDASLSLQGNSQGQHTFRGDGGIRLREANLAKLPAIIQLLNIMRISRSPPDVFTDANINFRIDGPTAYFSNFDLHGESLSLKGQGRMELDRRVFLKFYSLLGGERMYSKWMRPFVKETSERLLQIYVTGTADNLKVSQEMGPGWKELFPNQTVAGDARVIPVR